jgi:hypothetical protein
VGRSGRETAAGGGGPAAAAAAVAPARTPVLPGSSGFGRLRWRIVVASARTNWQSGGWEGECTVEAMARWPPAARAGAGAAMAQRLNRQQGEGHGLHLGAPAAINAARSPRPWPACAIGGHHGDHRSDGGPSGRSDAGYGWHTARGGEGLRGPLGRSTPREARGTDAQGGSRARRCACFRPCFSQNF